MRKNRKNNKGQTLIEVMLLIPALMMFLYFFIDMCLYMVDQNVAKYAAFCAARSYQVYGDEISQGEKIYEMAGRQVIELSTPVIKKEEIEIVVDTLYRGDIGGFFPNTEYPKAKYDELVKRYGFGNKNLFDNGKDEYEPGFGLLRVSYKRTPLFFSGLKIPNLDKEGVFDYVEAVVPYRIEERKSLDAR